MTFKKGIEVKDAKLGQILDVEWQPIETDNVKANKESLKELDKVLDGLELTTEELKRLNLIIQATK